MASDQPRRALRWRFLVGCALLATLACSKSGPLKKTTVKGKVTLGDKPVTGGALRFFANVDKGNTAGVIGLAEIGPQGEDELATDRGAEVNVGPGLPLGWYKVVYVPPENGPAPDVDASFNLVQT